MCTAAHHGKGAFAPENLTAEAAGSDPTSGNPDRVVKAASLSRDARTPRSPGTPGAVWMIEQVNKYPGGVAVYAGGALTNIALAVRAEPRFASRTRGLVVMGGHIDTNLLHK